MVLSFSENFPTRTFFVYLHDLLLLLAQLLIQLRMSEEFRPFPEIPRFAARSNPRIKVLK